MHLYEVLRRPLITEKSTVLQAQGKYAFEVAGEANKPQIKQAVEKAYKVKVAAVNVMMVSGKRRRLGQRQLAAPRLLLAWHASPRAAWGSRGPPRPAGYPVRPRPSPVPAGGSP